MQHFQTYINKIVANIQDVCVFCRLFLSNKLCHLLNAFNLIFKKYINIKIFIKTQLNSCGKHQNEYSTYKTCRQKLTKTSFFKLGFVNKINISTCQNYLLVLEDIILVKKTIIACVYLVIFIIKLRSEKFGTIAFYQCICNHAVVFSQNLGSLLIILPSKSLALYNII